MHVLIIPSWYKNKENPMAGTFFEEQARGLLKKGHQVGILYPSFYNFSSGFKGENYQIDDDEIPTLYCFYKAIIPKSYRLNYYWFSKAVLKMYEKYVGDYGTPDIIHAHTVFYGGIAARYIAKKKRIPYVLTEHFTPFITGGIVKKADVSESQKVYEAAAKNVIVSEGFRDLLINQLNLRKEMFQVVPNMVNNVFFIGERKQRADKEAPVFFTVSFLTERKNHYLMLEAFAQFLEQYPKAVFKIGGDGPYKESIVGKIKDLKIEKNVTLLGELSRQQIADELTTTDVFLLASKFETFGVVLIEALAAGVPVLTTDSIGPRDIVNEKNGIIVNSFDPKDFYVGMLDMVKNYNKYDKAVIADDCKARFSEEQVISMIEEIYTGVLNK